MHTGKLFHMGIILYINESEKRLVLILPTSTYSDTPTSKGSIILEKQTELNVWLMQQICQGVMEVNYFVKKFFETYPKDFNSNILFSLIIIPLYRPVRSSLLDTCQFNLCFVNTRRYRFMEVVQLSFMYIYKT